MRDMGAQALDVVAQLLPAADATHPWLDATSPAATVLKSLLMGRLPPAGSHVRLTVPASVAESQTAWFAVPPDRGTGARHSPHNTDTHMAPLLHAIPPEVRHTQQVAHRATRATTALERWAGRELNSSHPNLHAADSHRMRHCTSRCTAATA